MAFDALEYPMMSPFPLTQPDVTQFYTTAEVIKKFTPGQYAFTWDPLYQYRIFKLMKNLSGSTFAAGNCLSYVNPASVGSITAGTTTQITTSGQTANDFEWQMINVVDDAGAAGAAPEGETSLCIGNTATIIDLHQKYAFSTAIGASDSCYVIYQNGLELAASGDVRGPGLFANTVAGIVYSAVPDNYWGWVCQRGWVCAACDATSGLVAGDVKVDANSGYVTAAGATDGAEYIIGQASTTQNAATASSSTHSLFWLDVFTTLHHQTTP